MGRYERPARGYWCNRSNWRHRANWFYRCNRIDRQYRPNRRYGRHRRCWCSRPNRCYWNGWRNRPDRANWRDWFNRCNRPYWRPWRSRCHRHQLAQPDDGRHWPAGPEQPGRQAQPAQPELLAAGQPCITALLFLTTAAAMATLLSGDQRLGFTVEERSAAVGFTPGRQVAC